MASIDEYLKDPEYTNWVKSGLALNITNEVLRPFVVEEITKLHQSIVKQLPPGVSCGGCSVNPGCPNGICDKIQREIKNKHWYPNPSFENTCTGRWSTEPWEIAKCYMPPMTGYRHMSASKADFSACINVIINCKHFQAFGTSDPNIKETIYSKSKAFRNRVMHAYPQKVTENDMRENLDILIDILNKIKTPETEDDTKEAITKIQKTIQMKINIGDAIEMEKNATEASADKPEKDEDQVQRERMIANFEAGCRKALCRITEEHISRQKGNLSVAAFLSKIEILAVIKNLCSKHKEILFTEDGTHKDIREWDLFVYCFILEELDLSEPLENAVSRFVQEVKTIRNNLLLDATGVTQDDLSESCDFLIDTDLNTEITAIFNKDSPDVDVIRSFNSLESWWRQEEEYGNKQVSLKQLNETKQAVKELREEFNRRFAEQTKAIQNLIDNREHVRENVTLQGANAAEIIIDAESELRVRGCDEKTEKDLQEHITSPDHNNIERNEAFDHFREQRKLLEVNPVKGSIILNVKCSSITNVIDFWDSCMDGRAVKALSKVRDYYRRYFECETLEFDVILTKKGVSRCVNKIVEGLSSRFDVLVDNVTYKVQEILKSEDIQPIPGLDKDSMVVDDGSDILVKSEKPSLSLHEETDIKPEEERTKEENQFKGLTKSMSGRGRRPTLKADQATNEVPPAKYAKGWQTETLVQPKQTDGSHQSNRSGQPFSHDKPDEHEVIGTLLLCPDQQGEESVTNMASRDYYRDLSRRLSRVMDNIGVYREAVIIQRRNYLFLEEIETLKDYLRQQNCTTYIFGSQTEGTTTAGLHSDLDILIVYEDYNLIQNKEDWVPGKNNLMMIQNKRFPGYCKLQFLEADGPHPERMIPHVEYTFDEAGRVWLNHNFQDVEERHGPAASRHVPAVIYTPAIYFNDGSYSCDLVYAIRCKTWPSGYRMWSTQSKKRTWPTPEMISYMEKSGCFLVPVAHCLDEKKSESWRISTSLAERCLMFSLNITQIRCYILIKMIVKTFIDPVIPDVISSYICKNLLFHCIENTRSDFWQESNLLRCVNQVLLNMLEAIRCMNCPNYFNNSINLLLGKVNKDNQVALMGVIWKVLVSEGGFLQEIRYDNINELMHSYRETGYQGKDSNRDEEIKRQLRYMNAMAMPYCSYIIEKHMLSGTFNQQSLTSLQEILLLFSLQGPPQYVTATLLFPFLSRTSQLYELNRESDATSSSLRYASYLYCTGQFERTFDVLVEVENRILAGINTVCGCDLINGGLEEFRYDLINGGPPMQWFFPMRVSTCVMFSQAERQCCPRELQYEMYRSTGQEKLQRDKYLYDKWMDLACIDPFPYLYFLFYMTSRHIGYRDLQLLALEQLKINTRMDMGHSETVYNLLGQCYEYENLFDEAFACYCKSLRVRPTNNAARWHIVLLLNTVYQNQNE